MVPRHSQRWGRSVPRGIVLLAGVVALAISPPARAVTTVSVEGRTAPYSVAVGESVTIHFDVAKTGGSANYRWVRDLTGSGLYDPAAPLFIINPLTDGGSGDTDAAPGQITWVFTAPPTMPAGRYVLQLQDSTDATTAVSPGWIIAPKPEAQSISGRVSLGPGGTAPGSPPADAIVWAYSDLSTSVASADIRADGSYTLPVPPGQYIVFAEWFGNLRSQRQVVTVAAGQQAGPIDHTLLVGQELSGTLRDDAGKPMADALVTATSAAGAAITTQTFFDGQYVLVLPAGKYRISARGMEKVVEIVDQPFDGVDFAPPASASTPATGTIITVAGNGQGGLGGEGGPAISARTDTPQGLALDRAGNLYIAQNILGRVQKLDGATGRLTTVAGRGTADVIRGFIASDTLGNSSGDGGPATQAELFIPQWVTVDGAGNLYVSEVRGHRVRRVDAATGMITTVAGSGPIGVGKGSYSGDNGPGTAATLNGPQAMAIDGAGNLYIADNLNGRVRKLSPDGILTTVAGGGKSPVTDGADALSVTLGRPRNVALDGQGNLYLWDGSLNRVLKLREGELSFYAGNGTAGFSGDGGPATAAQLNAAFMGMAVDSAGNLFLVDQNNSRVRKVSPEGIISTVAGSSPPGAGKGGYGGNGGPATAAQFSNPNGIAIDASGNVYVADTLNKRVRKIIGIAAPGLVAGQ
jgi:sugar lactone lactonase YvrE